MKEKVGEVFSIARDNAPVPGCTISKEVHSGENYITYFSLARNTDISAEIYPYHKMLIAADGSMEVYGSDGFSRELKIGDSIITYTDTPMGMRSAEGTGLSEHAAPGEAIIFALDGEGVIGYEGKEHPIKAGENFHFAKAGLHSVKATKKFKMALLLTLE